MENIFVECTDPDRVVAGLRAYRRRTEHAEGWDFTPSYPVTLKISPLRTTLDATPDFPAHSYPALSLGSGAFQWTWIQVVGENNVVDLALARWLSKTLCTGVLAVFSYDGADTYGSRFYRDGELKHDECRIMEERADYRTNQDLRTLGIPYRIRRFRECGGPGWLSLVLNPEP